MLRAVLPYRLFARAIVRPNGLRPVSVALAPLRRRLSSFAAQAVAASSDTIFALATASGRSAIAVIRLSGPESKAILEAMARPPHRDLEPRKASLRTFIDPQTGEEIDRGLALYFPAPGSFTGDDCVELHCHGSRAVVKRLLAVIGHVKSSTAAGTVRPAAPGEFARRALLNGKFSLTEAEGLADLIDSDTDDQRRQALRQVSGEHAKVFTDWRQRLTQALAFCEAHCDFAETEDTDAGDPALRKAKEVARGVAAEIEAHLRRATASNKRALDLRDGFSVAILGAPNAGKSSLLNLIAGRDVAIVSPIAGTTRDVLEVRLDLQGLPVVLSDTAGLRETSDVIEAAGIARAKKAASEAALKLFVLDARQAVDATVARSSGGFGSDNAPWPSPSSLSALKEAGAADGEGVTDEEATLLLAVNKTDTLRDDAERATLHRQLQSVPLFRRLLEGKGGSVHFISCKEAEESGNSSNNNTTTAIDGLLAAIHASLAPQLREPTVFVRERHVHHAQRCLEHLQACLEKPSSQLDLAGEDLRFAVKEIGCLAGSVGVEDVLDELFSHMCIGK